MITTETYFSIPSDILPDISLANSVTIDLPYVHFRRTPTEYILYVVIDGVMYLTEDTTDYTLGPGDFIFLDPARCHYGREGSRCLYYYIHFSVPGITEMHCQPEEYFQTLSRQRLQIAAFSDRAAPGETPLLLPKYFHLPEHSRSKLQYQSKNLLLSYHQPIEYNRQTACCMLLSLFITMNQLLTDHALEENKQEINALSLELIAYLKIYYPEKITSERIESHFYKNFDYINRQFKKAIGKTIFQWLNAYRISEAKKLLQSNLYTLKQVADRTGFSNEFYFSRVFKKLTGNTPSEYQRQYRH